MKEHKKVALHVACGDITNATLENNSLVIRTSDGFLADVLENGRRDIEAALRWQGLDIKFEIIQFESNEQKVAKDVKKLENFFGSKVTIED